MSITATFDSELQQAEAEITAKYTALLSDGTEDRRLFSFFDVRPGKIRIDGQFSVSQLLNLRDLCKEYTTKKAALNRKHFPGA